MSDQLSLSLSGDVPHLPRSIRPMLARPSDARYHWIDVRMATVGRAEMREFVVEAWRMVVPKRVAAAHLSGLPSPPPG